MNYKKPKIKIDVYLEKKLPEMVNFLKINKKDKYYNIITMKENTALSSHHVSETGLKILIPQTLTESMKEKVDTLGFSSLEILKIAENLILKEFPEINYMNEMAEKEQMLSDDIKFEYLSKVVWKLL
jgi:hypothetical protein